MEHLQQAIIALIDSYGYVGLFVALALGNMAVPIGTEVILPVAGGLTATGHLSNLWLTIAVAVAGELAGGTVGYAIGRFGGVPLIERYGKYVHFTHARLMTGIASSSAGAALRSSSAASYRCCAASSRFRRALPR